jgi:ferritin-like metal-binding protein YciE
MAEEPIEVVKRYLQDAIAAEKSFETQLEGFSKEGDDKEAREAFAQHAAETRSQYERLTARLESLGGTTSSFKSFLAHLFGMTPKSAQLGHEEQERTTQNLIIAFSVENAECAMYEALITAAVAAGDTLTADLARQIQAEEKRTADKVWSLIAPSARYAFLRVTEAPLQRAL